jgi:ribonuclease BN (tRNA processing enzyme)
MPMSKVSIKFMGTGSAFSKKYGNTSALVTVENNNGVIKKLLIDCGRTTPDDLNNQGVSWKEIDAIFITHLHGDHVFGLEEAGFYSRYVDKRLMHLIFPHIKLKNDLWDKVLKGTMMNGDLPRIMTFEDYFTYESVNNEDQYFFFNDVMFSVYPTFHIRHKKSYGLIIGERDFIIYTGDSLLNKDLIEMSLANDCQAVFHDCQLFSNLERVHASIDDLLTLDETCRRSIHIMHYGDNLPEHFDNIEKQGFNIAYRGVEYEFEVGEF